MAKWAEVNKYVLFKEDGTYMFLSQTELLDASVWVLGRVYAIGTEQKLTISAGPA